MSVVSVAVPPQADGDAARTQRSGSSAPEAAAARSGSVAGEGASAPPVAPDDAASAAAASCAEDNNGGGGGEAEATEEDSAASDAAAAKGEEGDGGRRRSSAAVAASAAAKPPLSKRASQAQDAAAIAAATAEATASPPPPPPPPPPQVKATVRAPTWVSSPILGMRYTQSIVSSSPFASAKTPLARTESARAPVQMTAAERVSKEKGGGTQHFSRKMTYPMSITTEHSYLGDGFPHTCRHEAAALARSAQPNPYWQTPPPTMRGADLVAEKERLPRDELHPLISAVQAAENVKAGLFNANLHILASPSRRQTPSACRAAPTAQPATQPSPLVAPRAYIDAAAAAAAGPAAGYGGGAMLAASRYDDDLDQTISEGGAGGGGGSGGGGGGGSGAPFGLLSTLLGGGGKKGSAAQPPAAGGMFPSGAYAPAAVGGVRPTSLTGIAARLLCGAIHAANPPNSIPSNAAASARQTTQEPYRPPRYGIRGTTGTDGGARRPASAGNATSSSAAAAGTSSTTGATSASASAAASSSGPRRRRTPAFPPSQSFRLLDPGLQSILRERGGFTRSKVAAFLYNKQPVTQPPPRTDDGAAAAAAAAQHAAPLRHASLRDTESAVPPEGSVGEGSQVSFVGSGSGSGHAPRDEATAVAAAAAAQTPQAPPGVGGAGGEEERPVFLGVRADVNLSLDELEEETPDGDFSETCVAGPNGSSATYGVNGTSLSLWRQAVVNSTLAPNAYVENIEPTHVVKEVTCGAKLHILTAELITAFNIASNKVDFRTYFTSQGLRMGDHLTQVSPLSPSKATANPHDFASSSGGGSTGGAAPAPPPPGGASFLATPMSVGGASSGEVTESGVMQGAAAAALLDKKSVPSASFAYDNHRFLSLLTEKGTEVEQVFLEGMQWLSVEATSRLGDFCPQLRLLNLARCDSCCDQAAANIARMCKLLSYVNVSSCLNVSSVGISAFIENCPHLSVLCCHSLPHIDPHGTTFSRLHLCRSLQVLDVSYCEDISDQSLTFVAQYCPGLVFLDISGCHKVGDGGLRSLGGRLSFLQVWRSKMLCQPTVTGRGLSMLTQAPRSLKELDLGGVTQLDDAMLQQIVSHASALVKLSLAGCVLVTDTGLRAVTSRCRQLRVLNLSSCRLITLAACLDAIYDVTSLRCLIVTGSSISQAEVSVLQCLRQGCKVVLNCYKPKPVTQIWTRCQSKRPEKKKAKDGDDNKKRKR